MVSPTTGSRVLRLEDKAQAGPIRIPLVAPIASARTPAAGAPGRARGTKTFIAGVAMRVAGWRDGMTARIRGAPGWRCQELATGYDAMITAPAELTALLLEVAQWIAR